MKFSRFLGASILLSSGLAMATSSTSKKPAPPPAAEEQAPPPGEQFHWQVGPKTIDLGHDVQLALPAGDAFLGMPEADRLLQKQGSFNNQSTLGIVVSADEKQSWEIVIDYEDAGYVKDDEKIDADAL